MNEQILLLAEQAGWDMGRDVEGFNTRLERFAELVVLKTIDQATHIEGIEHIFKYWGIEPC